MNALLKKHGDSFKLYSESSTAIQNIIRHELLEYATSQPEVFQRELEEVILADEFDVLPIVLEALMINPDRWEPLYIRLLDLIFQRASQAKDTEEAQIYLLYLIDFTFIAEIEHPLAHPIANRIYQEIDNTNESIQIKAMEALTEFLSNQTVQNREEILTSLQRKLYHRNPRLKFAVHDALAAAGLLPQGFRLSLLDRIKRQWIR